MKTTVRLTESAVMLATAFVLSLIPVVQMPFGGDVTLASMLPVIVIAYRHGTKWGLLVGVAASLLQLLTGLDNLSYATSAAAGAAIILLDYILAFTVLGLGGMFRKVLQQNAALPCGVLVCCVLRYICHVISGCTVWAGVSIPDTQGLLYSLSYNAAYMVPETIITVAAAMALTLSLDLSNDRLRRTASNKQSVLVLVCSLLAVLFAAVGAVWLFRAVQTEEGFALTAAAQSDWIAVGVSTVLSVLFALIGYFKTRRIK